MITYVRSVESPSVRQILERAYFSCSHYGIARGSWSEKTESGFWRKCVTRAIFDASLGHLDKAEEARDLLREVAGAGASMTIWNDETSDSRILISLQKAIDSCPEGV